MSHPARGAWIEINAKYKEFSKAAGRTPRGVRGLKFKQCLELRQVLKSHTPQGVRGLKYLLCLRVNLNRESHPALWKSQEKSNEKSNDKVPDKVQFSMREPWRKPAT